MGRRSRRIDLFTVLTNIIMVLTIISVILPLYFLVITAFKTYGEVYKVPPSFSIENPSLEGFMLIGMYGADILKATINSLIVASAVTLSAIIFSTMAGYAFAIYRFKLKEALFVAVISKYILPEVILIVPWYSMMVKLKLIDTLFGVIVVNLIGAWTIFFTRSYIMQIPIDYIEAARIDGASDSYILFKIVFPMIKPAIGVATVINFLWAWNYFLWPLILLQSKEKFTLPLVVALVRYVYGSGGEMAPHLGAIAASSFIYILPVIILYLFAQRWIIEAFTMAGIKR